VGVRVGTRITYRRCRKKDLAAASRLVMRSFNDVRRRTGKAPIPWRPRGAPPFFAHLLRTDPGTFHCAWRGERLVGFGAALVRGRQWYLAWLFVDPRLQDRGIGRRLIERTWRDGRGMTHALATMTYNPGAVGLYSRFGMLPRSMISMMTRPIDGIDVPGPTGIDVSDRVDRRDLSWINGLEREIRGYPHAPEWRFWHEQGEYRILIFRRRGRRVGYGMISGWGAIQPVGATRAADLPIVMAETIRIAVAGARPGKPHAKLTVFCPQEAESVYADLIGLGFRISEILLFMSDEPYGDLTRYLPATLAVF